MKIRNLSYIEKDYWEANLPILIAVQVTELLDKDKVKITLNKLQLIHPFLRCVIKKENEVPYFFDVQEDMAIRVNFYKESSIQLAKNSFINNLLNRIYDSTKGLCEIAIIEDEVSSLIIFIVHHAICDAVSGLELVKTFFDIYRDSEFKIELFKAHSPIDDYIKNIILPSPKEIIDRYEKNLKKYNLVNILPDKEINRITTVKHISFSLDGAESIIKKSKTNLVSVHGIIGALWANALKQIAAKDEEYIGVLMQSAIDLRKRVEPSVDSRHLISAPIGPQSTFIKLGKDDNILNTALEITNYLKMDIDRNGHFDEMVAGIYSKFDYKTNKVGFFLSNGGKCPNIKAILENISFLSPVYYDSFFISFISEADKMHFNIVFREPWFDKKIVELFIDSFKKLAADFLIKK
ncbi:MAG: hypothetical protein K0R02_48 [Rickettsiaceae bacterium]|jgi:hypothetical protein|nr:hypothetical protein [Rickettsiaceae bacterium]